MPTTSVTAARSRDLAAQLEATFRLLGKRIYLPSVRQLRAVSPGLDQASVPLLGAIEERGECRPSDLAAAVELDLSTVSRQLRQLEQAGLVSRRPDSDDRRAFRIRLTESGAARLGAIRMSRARMLDEVFSSWPEDQRADLLRLLDRLLAALSALPTQSDISPTPSTTAKEESHS